MDTTPVFDKMCILFIGWNSEAQCLNPRFKSDNVLCAEDANKDIHLAHIFMLSRQSSI